MISSYTLHTAGLGPRRVAAHAAARWIARVALALLALATRLASAMPLPGTLVSGGATATVAGAPAPDAEKLRLRNELGIVQAKGGHLEDALRQFSLVLSEAPAQPAALNNAANVYFLQGQTDRARELYDRALGMAPKEGGVHLNLGLLLHTLGQDDASQAHLRQGLLLVGDVQHAYFLLGLSSQDGPAADGATSHTTTAAGTAAGTAAPVSTSSVASGGRAADETGLRTVEIEDLLARAMQKVPKADSLATHATSGESPVKMATRPGGTRAAQIEGSPQELYWMPINKPQAQHP